LNQIDKKRKGRYLGQYALSVYDYHSYILYLKCILFLNIESPPLLL